MPVKSSFGPLRRAVLAAVVAGALTVLLVLPTGARSLPSSPAAALAEYLNAVRDHAPVCALLTADTERVEATQYVVANYAGQYFAAGAPLSATTPRERCENVRRAYQQTVEGPAFQAAEIMVRSLGDDLALARTQNGDALLTRSADGWAIAAETETAVGPAAMRRALPRLRADPEARATSRAKSLIADGRHLATTLGSQLGALLARRRPLTAGALPCSGRAVTIRGGKRGLRHATMRARARTICIRLQIAHGVIPVRSPAAVTAGVVVVPRHGRVYEAFAGLDGSGDAQVLTFVGGAAHATGKVEPASRWRAVRDSDSITLRLVIPRALATNLREGFRWVAVLRASGLPAGRNGERALPAIPPDADLRGSLRRRLARYP